MVDLRKIVVIFIIAVLFSILVFATIDAVYPEPRYNDYCNSQPKPIFSFDRSNIECADFNVPDSELNSCSDQNGRIEYDYDSNGCVIGYECDMCSAEYENARKYHNMIVFIVSSIMSLIAIGIALFLPMNKELNEWIATGFMLGGLFALFYGTARYYGDMVRILRPLVILAELFIVIFLSYRKLDTKRSKKKK